MSNTTSFKTPIKITLGALGAIAVIGGTAAAVHAGGYGKFGGHHFGKGPMGVNGPALFDQMDANADQRVTGDEMQAARERWLGTYDKDGNAGLSLEEFQGLYLEVTEQGMIRRFQWLDRDGDGQVTEAEIAKPMTRVLAKLDRNDDGAIEIREIRRHHKHDHDDDDD